jgi:Rieske Fe-S protein
MHKLHVLPEQGERPCLSRREALVTMAAGAATAISACTNDVVNRVPGPVDSGASNGGAEDGGAATDSGAGATCSGKNEGALTSFPVGKWKKVNGAIVGHDVNGLFAYTTVCTHQGCTIGAPASDGTTTCPCHGAMYDGNGSVIQGPASQPLEHFAVSVCDGNVYVDSTMTVPADTRTPTG